MIKKAGSYRILLITIIVVFVVFVLSGGGYIGWNVANPEKTCNSCHEISPSYNTWTASAHREVSCQECHGTALSNGWHGFKEKTNMVFSHYSRDMQLEDIRLTEMQILETLDRCRNCHQTEYALWSSSGHSASYSDIFLHEEHNTTELLNFDCLRCHGMFYEGTIKELVEPISVQGPWSLIDDSKSDQATIPCMACHKIHSEGQPVTEPDYSTPDNIFYNRLMENKTVGFYSRHEKIHFALEYLPTPVMLNEEDTVKTPEDPVYRLCVQCHAPSVWHQAGSHDDHTPIGVHEGISCATCHEKHSNFQRRSCDKCHPMISNCNLDVKTMNTTFSLPSSSNDIHSVSCTDCHEDFQSHMLSGHQLH
jgi:nitrate/TMAO reductase-like tetraheme cytochrome c subunit